MNADGIIEFFYNIVPGSLFIILLRQYKIFDAFAFLFLNSSKAPFSLDPALAIFTDVALGLFLGFVFQGITKFARDVFSLNAKITEKIKLDNPKEYSLIVAEIGLTEEYPTLKVFYLMDSFLRGNHPAFLPTHFSSRFAFWANVLIAISILIILRLAIKHTGFDNDNILLVIFGVFSWDMAKRHFSGYYDSILKSYFMLKGIKYKK